MAEPRLTPIPIAATTITGPAVTSGYQSEKDLPPTPDFEEISAEKVEQAITQINEALKNKEVSGEVKKN
jgi:hypothetical protein